MWTKFDDMYSGGSKKLEWCEIYIELPEKKAAAYFESKFDRNPYNTTCSCCGQDYWIEEIDSLPDSVGSALVIRIEDM